MCLYRCSGAFMFFHGIGGAAPALHSLIKPGMRAVSFVEEGLESFEAFKSFLQHGLQNGDVKTLLDGGPNLS